MGSGSLVQALDADDLINYDVLAGGFGQPGLDPSGAEPSAASECPSHSPYQEEVAQGVGASNRQKQQGKKNKKHQKDYLNLTLITFMRMISTAHSSELSQLTPAIQP